MGKNQLEYQFEKYINRYDLYIYIFYTVYSSIENNTIAVLNIQNLSKVINLAYQLACMTGSV